MSPNPCRLAASSLLLLVLAGRVAADEPTPTAPKEPGALALATERVVVFKDGFGLFVKRAEGTADAEGRVFTEEVPDAAVLGTFWATSGDGEALAMHAGWRERREVLVRTRTTTALTIPEVLRANVGREVILGLAREGAPEVRGTIAGLLETPPEPAPAAPEPRPVRPGPLDPPTAGIPAETVRALVPQGGSHVRISQGGETLVLPVAEVRTVRGTDLATTVERREEVVLRSRTKRLTFDLGAAAAGKPAAIHLLYFRPGVRWMPTYRLSGDLEARGDLSLQAEVVNEGEDFRDAAVDLVVGVPNFRYREVVSPLILESTMRLVLRQDERSGQLMTQNLVSNRFANESLAAGSDDEAGAEALRLAPDLAAGQGQDLFVYRAPRLSLKRGERATVPLWRTGVPLRHLYTFDVSLDPDDARVGRERTSPLRIARNDVWHQVEIANATESPWTTGSVLLLRDGLPLGQEMLGYTSRGGKVLVPVTVAVDVQGTHEEEEIERRHGVEAGSRRHTVVRKRVTVTVVNRRAARSDVRIAVQGLGRAEKASEGGRILLDADGGSDAVNNRSTVRWDATIEPGGTAAFTCEVEIWFRE